VAVWAIVFLYQEAHAFIWPWEEILERSQQNTERSFFDEMKVVFGHYLVLSICIWVALTPLSVHHFHRFSLLTPIINLLLWPLVLLLILSAFALVPLAMVSGLAAALLVEVARGLSSHIEALLEVARNVPGFAFYTPGPPGWWVAGSYLVICAWAVRERLPHGRRVFLGGIVVLGLLYGWVDLGGRRSEDLEFTLADVGHGQCAVFRLPSGGCMLYDAGSSSPGRVRGVEGLLWGRRVRRIDALTLSHRDSDHCSFVPRLNHRFGIERMFVAPLPSERPPGPIERTLRQVPAERTLLTQGAEIRAGDLHCTVLHPDAGFLVQGRSADNDRSVAMMCRYRGWRILLTGDIEGAAIRHLIISRGKKLRADLLVLPHHGSWEPGLKQFLRSVSPRIALASNYRQVDERTTAALRELDIPLWTTRSEGAITIRLTPDAVELSGYTSGRRIVLRRANFDSVSPNAGTSHARGQ
jgi:competence protein ComEC